MYADGALAAHEAELLEQHAESCGHCRSRIAALRGERELLRAALRQVDAEAPIPRFEQPFRRRDLVALVIGSAVVGTLANVFWSGVVAAVPEGLRWLNPLQPAALASRVIELVTFIALEGTTMWTTAQNVIGVAVLLALAAWAAVSAARRSATGAAAIALAIVAALPSLGHALERREGELVTVAAGETIDDTLLATGETIAIDGDVNGDLLAFGRRITVRGNVTGNLFAGGETIDVEGTVGGSVVAGARALSLARARVGRDLYGAGRDVDIEPAAEVSGNVVAFGENIGIDGRVGADLFGFASTVTIAGTVGGDVEGFAGSINLLPSARIVGNVTAHVDGPGDLDVAASTRSSCRAKNAATVTSRSATTCGRSYGSAQHSSRASCCSGPCPRCATFRCRTQPPCCARASSGSRRP
jgi:cytoskeletal protein CcmA (bactofilin family)